MKARLVHTKIWQDDWFSGLCRASSIIYLYLLPCPENNLSGVFELPDKFIRIFTNTTEAELEQAKKDFEGKVSFYKGWVKLHNTERYQNFSGAKNEIAKEKELKLVPPEVLDTLSIGYRSSIDTLSNNSSNNSSNNLLTKRNVSNKETSNEKPQQNKKSEMSLDDKAKWVIDTYNQIFGKRLKVYKAIKANLAYWLDAGYSANDIKKALEIAKYDEYWSDKITPTILLRQKNTRGEEVDYIGSFLAKDTHYVPTSHKKKTGILEILAAKDAEKNKGGQDE